ncbi:DUF134 domain-containing protein [Candidatus Woesearchaeota archaeon]|nr:DUF134 domain-containing protein [Candidatus Woesearchaeota archaeon]
MPRPRRYRMIGLMPNVTYFKPAGIRMVELEVSILTVDEFEAIRLKDFLGLDQENAAKKMKISQPTFHRLILTARKKIADAMVNGKAIRIEGGNFKMVQQSGAGRGFGRGIGQGRGTGMGRGMGQGAGMVRGQSRGRGRMGGFAAGPIGTCRCPNCGHEEEKQRGVPCIDKKCPRCGAMMARGD